MSDYVLLELHNNKEYEVECCEMLNNEWKRSATARLHSLQKSSPDFPISLIYLKREESVKKLVGYAKVCRVLTDETGCWVESVIVKPESRNCGLGRKLMNAVEDYAKVRGFSTVYLMTDDKEGFYKKLGYLNCDPVCSVEGKWDSRSLQNLKGLFRDNPAISFTTNLNNAQNQMSLNNCSKSLPPPPPPPPLLPNFTTSNLKSTLDPNKNCIYLKKKVL